MTYQYQISVVFLECKTVKFKFRIKNYLNLRSEILISNMNYFKFCLQIILWYSNSIIEPQIFIYIYICILGLVYFEAKHEVQLAKLVRTILNPLNLGSDFFSRSIFTRSFSLKKSHQ